MRALSMILGLVVAIFIAHFANASSTVNGASNDTKYKTKTESTAMQKFANNTAIIEFNYIMPSWEMAKSSQDHGLHIIGVSDEVAKAMLSWNTKQTKRCEVQGLFRESGVYISSAKNCRGILVDENS